MNNPTTLRSIDTSLAMGYPPRLLPAPHLGVEAYDHWPQRAAGRNHDNHELHSFD
jgi:hypothetical protein